MTSRNEGLSPNDKRVAEKKEPGSEIRIYLCKPAEDEYKDNINQLVPGTGKKFPYFAEYSLSRSIIKISNIIP